MYTLLVGKPPFETSSLKETYARIKQVEYKTPAFLSKSAMNMIASMLQGNPSKRPSVNTLIKDPFFTSGTKKEEQEYYPRPLLEDVLNSRLISPQVSFRRVFLYLA